LSLTRGDLVLDSLYTIHHRHRVAQLFNGRGLEPGEPVHRHDLDPVPERRARRNWWFVGHLGWSRSIAAPLRNAAGRGGLRGMSLSGRHHRPIFARSADRYPVTDPPSICWSVGNGEDPRFDQVRALNESAACWMCATYAVHAVSSPTESASRPPCPSICSRRISAWPACCAV